MIQKALAFIYRNDKTELLCFEHPITKWIEVVRGTVEENENPKETIIRELYEEAGIHENEIKSLKFLSSKVFEVPGGRNREGELEKQEHFAFEIKLKNENKESFRHFVESDGIDNGEEYNFYWQKVTDNMNHNLNPEIKELLIEIKKIV